MGFFSRKKERKRDVQRHQGKIEYETRTDVNGRRIQAQSKDVGSSRELSGSHHEHCSPPSTPTSTRKSKQPSHSRTREAGHNGGVPPQSKNGTMSPKQVPMEQTDKHLPTPPRSPPPVKIEQINPPSILHKSTHFGIAALTSPPTIVHPSPVPAYNINTTSRVRFTAPSGGSVASQSEASNVHMMAGSFASSSAMSSGMVVSEEDRRLAAMGMGRADPKSDAGRYTEEHDRLNAMGVDHKSVRLNAMGMSRFVE